MTVDRVPALSIVMPTYNSANTVREALASVEAQTFRDFEVIVVDDASTDGTPALLQTGYAGVPGRRLIALSENGGPARSRNRGIREARAEWVAFLDSDDLWTPRRLELQMRLAQQHPGVVMFCGRPAPFRVDEDAIEESHERHGRWGVEGDRFLTLEELSEHNPIATSTVLVRRDVLEKLGGFDPQFRGPEDYDLWLRIAAAGKVYYSSEVLSRYRYGELSLSTDDRRFLPQVLRVLEKAYAPGGALHGMGGKRRAFSYQYLSASWMAAEQRHLGRAWRLLGLAVYMWPWNYGKYCALPWGRLRLAVRFVRIGWKRQGVTKTRTVSHVA